MDKNTMDETPNWRESSHDKDDSGSSQQSWREYPRGFPRYAACAASDENIHNMIFRRFDRLRARRLLTLEAELIELEARQDELDRELPKKFGWYQERAMLSVRELYNQWDYDWAEDVERLGKDLAEEISSPNKTIKSTEKSTEPFWSDAWRIWRTRPLEYVGPTVVNDGKRFRLDWEDAIGSLMDNLVELDVVLAIPPASWPVRFRSNIKNRDNGALVNNVKLLLNESRDAEVRELAAKLEQILNSATKIEAWLPRFNHVESRNSSWKSTSTLQGILAWIGRPFEYPLLRLTLIDCVRKLGSNDAARKRLKVQIEIDAKLDKHRSSPSKRWKSKADPSIENNLKLQSDL